LERARIDGSASHDARLVAQTQHPSSTFCLLNFNYFAALSGKFPGDDFIDNRLSRPPSGNVLDANLGRFPLIQTSQGVAIGQSRAINFYVANICDMLGDNPTETALVLSFSEHVQARFLAFVSVERYIISIVI
jgi:hypothetical protein